MRQGFFPCLSVFLALALSGCSTDTTSGSQSGLEFRCGEDESFETISLAYAADGKSVVLSMGGEEHRLTLEDSEGGLTFSKDDIYLWASSTDADFVEVEDESAHRNCHLQQEG